MKKTLLILFIFIVIIGIIWFWWQSGDKEQAVVGQLSIAEAISIAQQTSECSMTGILSQDYVYNEITKTWWFDLERVPELEKDGCNPACVVDEQTKTAEVNWRCTGVIPPLSTQEAIRTLLSTKYGRDAAEINITINKETENYAQGTVLFEPGGSENSGMFLAAKVNDAWNLIHDGQGAVLCSDIEPYNFPVNMISECLDEGGNPQPR